MECLEVASDLVVCPSTLCATQSDLLTYVLVVILTLKLTSPVKWEE